MNSSFRLWLKTAVLSAVVALAAGCGKDSKISTPVVPKTLGPCFSVTNGNWQDLYNAQHQLILNDQCQGATTYCNESFTVVPQVNGTVVLSVTASNIAQSAECLPLGATTCTAAIVGGQLSVNCGVGKAISSNYSKL